MGRGSEVTPSDRRLLFAIATMDADDPTLLTHYRQMARYNRWMNEKLYALAGDLSDEERKRPMGAFFGSIPRHVQSPASGRPRSARALSGAGSNSAGRDEPG